MTSISHLHGNLNSDNRILIPAVPRSEWSKERAIAHTKYRRWIQRPELAIYRADHPWSDFSEYFRLYNASGYDQEKWEDGWTYTAEQFPDDFQPGDRIGHQVILEIDSTFQYFLIGCDCGSARLRHHSDFRYLHACPLTCSPGCWRAIESINRRNGSLFCPVTGKKVA